MHVPPTPTPGNNGSFSLKLWGLTNACELERTEWAERNGPEVALLLEKNVVCLVPVEYADFMPQAGPVGEGTGSGGSPSLPGIPRSPCPDLLKP